MKTLRFINFGDLESSDHLDQYLFKGFRDDEFLKFSYFSFESFLNNLNYHAVERNWSEEQCQMMPGKVIKFSFIKNFGTGTIHIQEKYSFSLKN